MNRLGEYYAKQISQTQGQILYNLYVESENYNKLVNITKKYDSQRTS